MSSSSENGAGEPLSGSPGDAPEAESLEEAVEEEQAEVTRDSIVTLREITADNSEEIFVLKVAPEQKDFVASNERSLAQALFSKNAWYRAIYADETPVGFVMLYDDPENSYYFLWRFMVDARYQRMGFGRAAIELLKEHVRSRPNGDFLGTSFVPAEGGPGDFYVKLGFTPTGEMEDDEVVVSIPLW